MELKSESYVPEDVISDTDSNNYGEQFEAHNKENGNRTSLQVM